MIHLSLIVLHIFNVLIVAAVVLFTPYMLRYCFMKLMDSKAGLMAVVWLVGSLFLGGVYVLQVVALTYFLIH